MTAAPPRIQPTPEPVRRLVNGEFYAKRDKIFRAPIETKVEGGTNISVGFAICHVSDYVDAENLAECLNASREVDGLKARAEQAERSVDVLESNAREQAKLLADTGRRVEELEHPFRAVDDLDWRHLLSFIPDSGHGRFWKAVFAEVRAALQSSAPEVSQ